MSRHDDPQVLDIPYASGSVQPKRRWRPRSDSSRVEAIAKDLGLDGKLESRTLLRAGPKQAPMNPTDPRGRSKKHPSEMTREERWEWEDYVDQVNESLDKARYTA